MIKFCAALGLGVAILSGAAVDAFIAPGGRVVALTTPRAGSRSGAALRGVSRCRPPSHTSSPASPEAAAAATRRTATVLAARAGGRAGKGGVGDGPEEERLTSASAAMGGVGSVGSNVLLFVTTAMVLKGLLLPEDVRHLGFCPLEDPVRGRDTLPWRMMIESGRECGTIPEVMKKYVTAPLVFPGTPEWGMMLNVKEDLAKDTWLQ